MKPDVRSPLLFLILGVFTAFLLGVVGAMVYPAFAQLLQMLSLGGLIFLLVLWFLWARRAQLLSAD